MVVMIIMTEIEEEKDPTEESEVEVEAGIYNLESTYAIRDRDKKRH